MSIDHAHLHVVPGVDITDRVATDAVKRLDATGKFFRVDRIEGWKRARDIVDQNNSSYMILQEGKDKRMIIEVNTPIPSQYYRRIIADKLESNRCYDWAVDPDYKLVQQTVEELSGKF